MHIIHETAQNLCERSHTLILAPLLPLLRIFEHVKSVHLRPRGKAKRARGNAINRCARRCLQPNAQLSGAPFWTRGTAVILSAASAVYFHTLAVWSLYSSCVLTWTGTYSATLESTALRDVTGKTWPRWQALPGHLALLVLYIRYGVWHP